MFISPNFHFKSASHGQFLNLLEILYHYEFPSCVNIAIEAAIGKQAVDRSHLLPPTERRLKKAHTSNIP